MLDRSRWAILMFGAGFTVLVGCIGPTKSNRLEAGGQSPSYRVWTEEQNADRDIARGGESAPVSNQISGKSLGDYRSRQEPTSKLSSFGRSISGAFKSAGHKVSDALEVKPKVTPAADPVQLSNMPESLSPDLYVRAAAFSESQGNLAAA